MRHSTLRTWLSTLAACLFIACGVAPANEGADAGRPAIPEAGDEPDAGMAHDAGEPGVDLTLRGIRLGILGEEDKPLRARVVHEATGAVAASLETVVVGPQVYTLPASIEVGEWYALHLYVDMDEDGLCDPSTEEGGDRGWSVGSLLGREGGTDISFHTRWIDEEVCSRFR